MDEMRKAFEAHCARNWIDTERVMDGPYKDASTQRAWEAWQAATMAERERIEPEVDWAAQNLLALSSDCGREWTKEVTEFLATCRGT